LGYFKDEAQTRAAIVDGWYHTGDLGTLTDKGLLKIVGRKKEIMKTSGGKMIAPVPIEERLKEAAMISQVCLVGDNRKFISALVTLSESILAEIRAENRATKDGLIVDSSIIARVEREVARVNGTLAGFEQVKKFAVIDREFSILDGEMTPTMKMKRRVIEEKFKSIVDGMYAAH
jgi:long-chain acyl-CoA synthetase